MAAVTERQILDALRRSAIPTRRRHRRSRHGLGRRDRDGHVAFAIEVEPRARRRSSKPLRKAAEKAVEALPGVLSVTAVLTAEQPRAPAAPRRRSTRRHAARRTATATHAAAPAQRRAAKPAVPGVSAIVAVASGKGGVGKSTIAVNLALALEAIGPQGRRARRRHLRPVDAAHAGHLRQAALAPTARRLQPMENYGVKCMSMGFLVAEDTPMIWRGPMVMSALQQMLREVEWGELDIMVVDMPPGTGDAQLTMAQQVPLAGAVIVSTPQDIALLDARKGLNMFRKVDVPVLGIIENMSYFLCPHCGERSEIFSHGGARREAEKLGAEFLGEMPLDIAIRETSDGGKPIVVSEPDSPHCRDVPRHRRPHLGKGRGIAAEGGAADRDRVGTALLIREGTPTPSRPRQTHTALRRARGQGK